MHARSALFDLYGDHLRSRGGRAPVAALVRLLAPLGITAPAVRTAVSRMVRQAWLEPVRLPEGPGYGLTARAARRLDEAAGRVYRTQLGEWDGRWHVLVVSRPASRAARERLRAGLTFLGYGALDDTTWVGVRDSPEIEPLLAGEGVAAERFLGEHLGDSRAMIHRLWDLDALAAAYLRWTAEARSLVEDAGESDEEAFAVRSALVHGWRKFLFTDPGLPRTLLPDDWPGDAAAALFDAQARRLAPAANRFVDACLAPAPGAAPTTVPAFATALADPQRSAS